MAALLVFNLSHHTCPGFESLPRRAVGSYLTQLFIHLFTACLWINTWVTPGRGSYDNQVDAAAVFCDGAYILLQSHWPHET